MLCVEWRLLWDIWLTFSALCVVVIFAVGLLAIVRWADPR